MGIVDIGSGMPRWLPYAIVAVFAVYFPAALWLQSSFIDAAPKGELVIQLLPPFETHGIAAISNDMRLKTLADREDVENDARSPVVIYENRTRLGPAHSSFADIQNLGLGRFAHWRNQGFVFSASDNSAPNSNGRHYWAVVP